MPLTKQTASVEPAIWIHRPWLDLIVGCGGWSLPLLAFAYFSSAASTLTWSVIFYFLALFLNYPHYMATIHRAYHTEEDFQKYRIFTVHITLLLALTAVLSHVWVGILPYIFTLYLTTSPWHYSGQNYGLFMMFARRAGIQPSPNERRALYAAFVISYGILFLNFHTGRSLDPLFISLNIPANVSAWAQIMLAVAFVAFATFGLSRIIAKASLGSLIPSLTLFSTQCVWFLLPTLLSLVERFRVPQSRYSTGVLAVMHSAQYLWITSYYAKREAGSFGGQRWRPLTYFIVLIAGGIALFIPGPWISSLVFHFDFTRSFLIFTALVNIHHFILDGAIWKLRDGRIAALLVNSRTQMLESATQARHRTMGTLRWLAGQNSGARMLRAAVVLVLCGWASIDQLHYYFALHGNDLPSLQHAAALVPYDAPLQTRLASNALADGKPQEAAVAWEYAIHANPHDPAPREAFLQYLTQQGKFEQAYRLTSDWIKLAPRDATLLLNHGVLAQQFGNYQEAEQSWRKALALDPSLITADLYLAAMLDQQGKPDAAIGHYDAFLTKVAQQPVRDRPPADVLTTVVLKLADCESRVNHVDRALQFYKMANKLAQQTREPKLESFSNIAEASLEAKLGHTDAALQLYQAALQLDARLDDRRVEATDWYLFARFLREAQFPPRLVYASLIRSQAPGSPDHSAASPGSSTDGLERELESELGPQASVIRRNPEPLLREALELKPHQ